MQSGRLKHRIEVWGNVKFENELLETDIRPEKIKTVWCEIIPQTGNMMRQQGIETILSKTTQKIITRYETGKNIKPDQWFVYKGHRFNIKYILDPFKNALEFFCEEVIE